MQARVDAFIERWGNGGGTERANYQLFLTELCALLDLPMPDPASADNAENAYVFERMVPIASPDGKVSHGFIDLYRRGSFVCEAKQSGKALDTGAWDKAMQAAHNQADTYVRSLPLAETRPPFILVVDVGRNIDVYAEFSRTGGTYTPFPDPRSHRIRLEDLHDEDVRERLRGIWLDPLGLDPSKKAAKVTREIADKLARLAKSLEGRGQDPQAVASFLMRTLFTMFAEDVGLLPKDSFTELLASLKDDPRAFAPMLEALWATMNTGGFSPILRQTVLRFNGGLFARVDAIPLEPKEFELLYDAAKADWRFVEPAIFGTLLERALDPRERHKLGAHYTPRAYVERLVFPTVIEPLRYEWENAKATALAYDEQGKRKEAIKALRDFQRKLAETRVLDPACGSGNFLYVTMEHMKRLEGEVLNLLHQLDESQTLLDMQGLTVDPHQFLGIEINPRAAKIAELVLWIGYLQWHFRTHGSVLPAEPVLRDFKNIENRDALIDYDRKELLLDDAGTPVTRWDGVTMKTSPITGELIPDESAQMEQYVYVNPRKAVWPEAEYIVGNPPFIGASTMRRALGDGYVDAVRKTWTDVPTSADFVMYWWHHSAELVRASKVRQFGFITTNSIKQTYNRRVLETHMNAKKPLALAFAIPDHPWVDSTDGAAVRIAMTVGRNTAKAGTLRRISREKLTESGDYEPIFIIEEGDIGSGLQLQASPHDAITLNANSDISTKGFEPGHSAFVVSDEVRTKLTSDEHNADVLIRKHISGRELIANADGQNLIDAFGLSEEDLRNSHPKIYQWLLEHVKPARTTNRDPRLVRLWWLHRRSREDLRLMLKGLPKFICTVETTKHRFFSYLAGDIAPSNLIVCIASQRPSVLGILSSRLHVEWALSAGGRLGVGNDPRYNKTRCFETFPFPILTPAQESEIGALAEQIDAHRKRQQAQHENLTLTNMYNVLEKLRSGEALTAKERETHEQGLVSILRELHDALDRAVFDAYGWSDLGDVLVGRPGATTPLLDKPEDQAEAEEELLRRLVELNAERAEEEKSGLIRWLRPEYQNPSGIGLAAAVDTQEELLEDDAPVAAVATTKLAPWPKTLPEQIVAVRTIMQSTSLRSADDVAAQFSGKNTKKKLSDVTAAVDSLLALGVV